MSDAQNHCPTPSTIPMQTKSRVQVRPRSVCRLRKPQIQNSLRSRKPHVSGNPSASGLCLPHPLGHCLVLSNLSNMSICAQPEVTTYYTYRDLEDHLTPEAIQAQHLGPMYF